MRPDLAPRRAHLTARFLRMLSLSLEQVALIRQALARRQFAGLGGQVQTLDHKLEDACLEALAQPPPELEIDKTKANPEFLRR